MAGYVEFQFHRVLPGSRDFQWSWYYWDERPTGFWNAVWGTPYKVGGVLKNFPYEEEATDTQLLDALEAVRPDLMRPDTLVKIMRFFT